ncbi:MAG TPA: Yip1 family protein [Gallionella sp.]|nr:Yip1 family protein [Gallionella sp.]
MAQLHLPHTGVWDAFTHSHMSVLTLFLLYAVPMSVIPPVMIYYAGATYGGQLFPVMSDLQLQTIGVLFFLAELAMTFVVAYVIQRMGDVIDIKPAFEDAYKLAVVAPTPLWLVPLFLFIPSVVVNITAISAALMISGILIFRNVPSILRVEEKGHAILLSGSILAAGLVAWAMMMYLTLISWSVITSNPML